MKKLILSLIVLFLSTPVFANFIALDICESMSDSSYKQVCAIFVKSKSFDDKALMACTTFWSGDAIIKCLTSVANKNYTDNDIKVCNTGIDDGERLSCLKSSGAAIEGTLTEFNYDSNSDIVEESVSEVSKGFINKVEDPISNNKLTNMVDESIANNGNGSSLTTEEAGDTVSDILLSEPIEGKLEQIEKLAQAAMKDLETFSFLTAINKLYKIIDITSAEKVDDK